MKFELGDTACLKSGGPVMTVYYINEDDVACTFFYGGDLFNKTFKQVLLNKVKKNSGLDWVIDEGNYDE